METGKLISGDGKVFYFLNKDQGNGKGFKMKGRILFKFSEGKG